MGERCATLCESGAPAGGELKAEQAEAAVNVSPAPETPKRGRPRKFTDEKLREAQAAKSSANKSGERQLREPLKVLYGAAFTDAQKRSVSKVILKHHSAKLAPPSKK